MTYSFSPGLFPALFGCVAALLTVVAFLPYMRDTLTGRTRPERASWLIWSVLSSISFLSQVYEGAGASLWFAGAQVAATITIFLLSIRNGFGRFLTRTDVAVLVLAGVGLCLWAVTESSAYALGIAISISLLGSTVTVQKAFRDPGSETVSTWVMCWIASCFGLLSVNSVDPLLLAYPLYLFTLYAAILIAQIAGTYAMQRRIQSALELALARMARMARA